MTAAPALPLSWSDDMKVHVDFIDDDHAEFIALMTAAAQAESVDLPAAFDALATHTAEHFSREEALMERVGFFAIGCHKDEHARVLAEVGFFRSMLMRGNETAVREYLTRDLPQWFILHRATMDSATAAFAREHA